MLNEHIELICNKLMLMFEQGSFPPAAARTVIAKLAGDDKPCNNWSFCNQLIMNIAGTMDARGFRQWQLVNRNVCEGARAIYILAPVKKKLTKTVVDPYTGLDKQEECMIIMGFKAVPVFRFEDTEGAPLPQVDYTPPDLPPLFNVAQFYGAVKYYPFQNRELGSCSSDGVIRLYSTDIDVFFHELAHQVHSTIKPLRCGQHLDQEIVAEMVSCILCELYGFTGYLWQGWEYMRSYAGKDSTTTLRIITSLLAEVAAVLEKIFMLEVDIEEIPVQSSSPQLFGKV